MSVRLSEVRAGIVIFESLEMFILVMDVLNPLSFSPDHLLLIKPSEVKSLRRSLFPSME